MRRIGVSTAIRLVYVVLSVVSGIVVARLGGAEVKGVVAAYSASSALFYLVGNLDLAAQSLRHARNQDDPGAAFTAVARAWAFYAVGLLVLGTLAFFVRPDVLPLLLAGVAYLAGSQAATVCRGIAGAVAAAAQSVVQPVTMITLTVILWKAGGLDVRSVLVALVLSFTTPAVVSVVIILRARAKLPADRVRARLRVTELLRDGLTWQPAQLAQFALTRVGTLGVFFVAGAHAAGVYSVGVSTAEFAGLISGQYAADLQHRAAMGGLVDTRATARKALVATAASMAPIAVAAWFLLAPVYGAEFTGSRLVVLAAAPGVIATSVILMHTTGRYFTEGPARVTITAVIGLGVTLLVMYPAAVEFGAVGAALAASLGSVVCALGLVLAPERHTVALVDEAPTSPTSTPSL